MPTWSQLRSPLLFVLALATTIAGGVVHGYWQQRWGYHRDVAAAIEKLGERPTEFGDWELVQARELSATERGILQNHAYLGGLYKHRRTGELVQFSILLGPTGPTSGHTPEVCLRSSAFTLKSARQSWKVPDREDRFWTATFRTRDVGNRPMRAMYAWRFDQSWIAPQQPRIKFGGYPYLYKLQLSCYADDETSEHNCADFLNAALPVLQDRML
jgi:hypothetical protein